MYISKKPKISHTFPNLLRVKAKISHGLLWLSKLPLCGLMDPVSAKFKHK